MIDWTQKEEIWELRLSKKPCNEIGTEMFQKLERFLTEIKGSNAKSLIIYSALESGFCAGADLRELYKEMISQPKDQYRPKMKAFLNRAHDVMNAFDMLPLSTIAVVHGACFGGGFELALTCDLIVAEPSARFCFPELRLGIIPGFGGIPRLKREVGNAFVRDLLFTGRSINAQKANTLGFVSQVVKEGEGLNVARLTARQTAKFDMETLKSAKAFIKRLPEEELEREKQLFLFLFERPNVIEALSRFVQSTDLRSYLP